MANESRADKASEAHYAPLLRTHRLITGVRVISASLTTFALLVLGPSVARHARLVLAMELAYVAFSVWLLVEARRRPYVALRRPIGIIAIDIAVVLVLVAETHGIASPFFAGTLFVVWAADYMAGIRGSLAVTALLMACWLTLAAVETIPAGMEPIFIMRTAAMIGIPWCLAWRRLYDDRNQSELSKLAGWPRGGHERAQIVRAMLECAAEVARVPHAVIVWEDEEEPWVNVAEWQPPDFRVDREGPERRDSLLMSAAGQASVLSARGTEAMLFQAGQQPARPFARTVVDDALRSRLGDVSIIATSIDGAHVAGRLYLLGRLDVSADDLTLAEIVSRLVAAELDRLALLEKNRATAAGDERVRLAGTLHDGLLQSMTAISMQLATLERQLGDGLPSASAALRNLRQIVVDDQRELRDFVLQARERLDAPQRPLDESLHECADRFRRRWGMEVDLHVEALPVRLPQDVAAGIYGIVHEGLANAAKHGGAQRVSARVGVDSARIEILIDDDGRGFPFRGRLDLAGLVEQKCAPAALRQRVTSLRGDMVVDSTPAGSRLQIHLPM